MRPSVDAVLTMGEGPDLVLVHGTASDRASWGPLSRLLRRRVRVTTYHRRGTLGWPVPVDEVPVSVDQHVEDLADLLESLGRGPVHLCGGSFGAVVALELCRARPDLVQRAALFEPSLAADDEAAPVPQALLADFERALAREQPELASERFHRRVLGDATWERLEEIARKRARSLWPHIYGDLRANVSHRVRYKALRDVEVPILLLRGDLTGEAFELQLSSLAMALPASRREVIERAGHQIGPGGWPGLADALTRFMAL